MSEKLARAVLIGLGLMLGAGVLFLAGRCLLPWTAPLLAAWALAALLEPAVGFLTRQGWRRGAAAGLCTLAALGLLLWGLAALLFRGLNAAAELTKALPGAMEAFSLRLEALEKLAEAHIRAAPAPAAQLLEKSLSALANSAAALPGQLSRALVALLSRTAQASPDTLLFLVTAALGTYFISASYPPVHAFLLAQLPDALRRRASGLGADLKSGFGGLLRAQLLLMLLCFFELLAAFLLLGIRSAFILAAVTAAVDALPVFGSGVVLLPWALYCLLLGNSGRGIGLLITWGLAELVRNAAQAKLLGDQIGLNPLASLLSVYVGWRVAGVGGMLLFPLGIYALIRLNDRGVVRLWKNV
jgi:sporulation integral membrane protein YtvI